MFHIWKAFDFKLDWSFFNFTITEEYPCQYTVVVKYQKGYNNEYEKLFDEMFILFKESNLKKIDSNTISFYLDYNIDSTEYITIKDIFKVAKNLVLYMCRLVKMYNILKDEINEENLLKFCSIFIRNKNALDEANKTLCNLSFPPVDGDSYYY